MRFYFFFKIFLLMTPVFFYGTLIHAMTYEKKAEEVFVLGDKFNTKTANIQKEENQLINQIKNLKLKELLLKKEKALLLKNKISSFDSNVRKINDYKMIINFIWEIKKSYPDFIKNDFKDRKNKLFEEILNDEKFDMKFKKVLNFISKEIDSCFSKKFHEGVFVVNKQKVKGRCLILGNRYFILQTQANEFFIWNGETKIYEPFKNSSLNGIKQIFSLDNPFDQPLNPIYLPR